MKDKLLEKFASVIAKLIQEIERDIEEQLPLKDKKALAELLNKLLHTMIKIEQIKPAEVQERISDQDAEIINDFLARMSTASAPIN